MTSLTITIPLPPKAVKPNSRCHWRTKAAGTKNYRAQAWAAAKAVVGGDPPLWPKVKMTVRAYFKTLQFPDPTNFMASLKAAEDGLQDAGVVANDKGLWPERPEFAKDALNPRVEITITEET